MAVLRDDNDEYAGRNPSGGNYVFMAAGFVIPGNQPFSKEGTL
jgi:hypothetical protein